MFSTFRKRPTRPRQEQGLPPDTQSDGAPSTHDDDVEVMTSSESRRRRRSLTHKFIVGLLPAALLVLALVAGFLKWQVGSRQTEIEASTESVRAASEGTVALLTYKPDSVDTDLVAARDNLTGDFLEAFTTLTDDVVIPGAKQQRIFSTATVSAAASVTASSHHAVVLVFVNQTTTVADDPPTETASTVKVTLDRVEDRWLISNFAPI